MAKRRYHQGMRDRMDEYYGEERHLAKARRDDRMEDSEHLHRNVVSGEAGAGHPGYRHNTMAHGGYRMRAQEQYAGHEESRQMMARDGLMIMEDVNAPCLLPRQVLEKEWPRAHNYHMGMVDTLFSGANKQLKEDYDDLGRELKPGKY